jgi:hypothetical protein
MHTRELGDREETKRRRTGTSTGWIWMRVRHERSLKIGQARAQAQGRSQKEKGKVSARADCVEGVGTELVCIAARGQVRYTPQDKAFGPSLCGWWKTRARS